MVSKSGRRFVVWGPPGSGKSTLARQISERTGLPCIELDAIFWLTGWKQKPLEEFRTDVLAALARCPDGWVCDGNQQSRLSDLVLPLADTVVWCGAPFPVAFWRLLRRTISRCWDGKQLWGTNRESWRQNFLSRDSLILYQLTHWRGYQRRGQRLEEIAHHPSVVRVRSQKEIGAFLKELG